MPLTRKQKTLTQKKFTEEQIKNLKAEWSKCELYLNTYKSLVSKFKAFKKIEVDLVEYLLKQNEFKQSGIIQNSDVYLTKLKKFIKMEIEISELKDAILKIKCNKQKHSIYDNYLNNVSNNLR